MCYIFTNLTVPKRHWFSIKAPQQPMKPIMVIKMPKTRMTTRETEYTSIACASFVSDFVMVSKSIPSLLAIQREARTITPIPASCRLLMNFNSNKIKVKD